MAQVEGGTFLRIVTYIFWFGVPLKIWFDGRVLFVKVGQVWDEILDDVGMGKRVDTAFFGSVRWDTA